MDMLRCSKCGHPYQAGDVKYCTVCGQALETSTNLISEIKQIERESSPYEALRFVAGLIVFFGWVVIIGGWLFALTIGAAFSGSIAKNLVSDGASSTVLSNMTYLVSGFIGFLATINGLGMIASGQIYMALLDIRNDTHTTMRLIRRFGLAMLQRQEQPQPTKEA